MSGDGIRRTSAGPRALTRLMSPRAFVALGVGFAVLVSLPLLLGSFQEFIATRILIMALFATAYNIAFGYGGMPSLGHAAFFGAGSYITALGVTRWEWGPLTICIITICVGAGLGALFGFVTQRTRGMYYLLLTLAIGMALWGLAFQQVAITRGDNGIAGIGRDIPLGASGDTAFYYYCLFIVALSAALLWMFTRSAVGQAIVGTRESETRMAALGYRVNMYRGVAMTVSGLFSAVAGMLFAYLLGFVGPDNLFWITGAVILIYAIFGGAAYFLGPALGAGVLIVTEVVVNTYTDRWLSVLGVIYILTVLFLPRGLASLPNTLRRTRTSGTGHDDASRTPVEEAV